MMSITLLIPKALQVGAENLMDLSYEREWAKSAENLDASSFMTDID
jgi:hypothetical protein